MENFEMTSFEEMVADEMFPETDTVYDSVNFPTKDRSRSAARRKKTYFKGKKRFTRFADEWGLGPMINNKPVVQGIMRKTNIKNPFKDSDWYAHLGGKRANARRLDVVNAAMVDYMKCPD